MLDTYAVAAQRYRPRNEFALAREVSRLFTSGLKPRDIAQALRLDIGEVLGLLRLASARVSE